MHGSTANNTVGNGNKTANNVNLNGGNDNVDDAVINVNNNVAGTVEGKEKVELISEEDKPLH